MEVVNCCFFKQNTAYEMRISDWSSDVCSSDLLMNVFEKVRSEYVDKVDDKTLIQGAINGMLASLDPHSSFLDERDFTNLRTQTDGAYGGLGLTVTMEDGAVKLVPPTADTPRSAEHTSELQSLMRTSYAVFFLKKKKQYT